MERVFFVGRSMTHTQIINKTLLSSGISARIVRADLEITRSGCAHAVEISPVFFAEAAEALRKNRVSPFKTVLSDGKGYRELAL